MLLNSGLPFLCIFSDDRGTSPLAAHAMTATSSPATEAVAAPLPPAALTLTVAAPIMAASTAAPSTPSLSSWLNHVNPLSSVNMVSFSLACVFDACVMIVAGRKWPCLF